MTPQGVKEMKTVHWHFLAMAFNACLICLLFQIVFFLTHIVKAIFYQSGFRLDIQ